MYVRFDLEFPLSWSQTDWRCKARVGLDLLGNEHVPTLNLESVVLRSASALDRPCLLGFSLKKNIFLGQMSSRKKGYYPPPSQCGLGLASDVGRPCLLGFNWMKNIFLGHMSSRDEIRPNHLLGLSYLEANMLPLWILNFMCLQNWISLRQILPITIIISYKNKF